jgi:hypothetical protein
MVAFSPLIAAHAQYQPKFTDVVLEVASNGVNVFQSAGAVKVQRVLGQGERVLWDGTSTQINGRTWIPIYLVDALVLGWATPDNDALYQVDTFRLSPNMEIGASGVLAQPRTVYDSVSLTSQSIGPNGAPLVAPAGASFRVIQGPVYEKLYVWWRVQLAGGQTGWIIDSPVSLQVTQPLTVYGVPVCDNFNISKYGVAGWDSALPVIRSVLKPNETIGCLASSNLRGDGTPVVSVLIRSTDPNQVQESLRVFGQVAGQWAQLFALSATPFARTERLGVYDLTGDGLPVLVWLVRNDGTGQYLSLQAFKYGANGTFNAIFKVSELYKGNVQIGVGNIVLFQPVLRQNEANCCPSGYNRIGYQWANNQFVKVLDDFPPPPYHLQPNG